VASLVVGVVYTSTVEIDMESRAPEARHSMQQ
jgi:hypothetical protein